jgi:cell division protease FtsH
VLGNRLVRNGFIYLLIIVAVAAILFTLFPRGSSSEDISFGGLIELAKENQVKKIVVEGEMLTITTVTDKTFNSRKEEGTSVYEILSKAGVNTGSGGVEIVSKGSGGLGSVFGIFINFLPLIFFGALLLFMMRQAQGGNSQAMSFGRSKARLFMGDKLTVTFADVAGVEEAKVDLQEVVEFLKYPERFLALGARIPKGILLVGPPGTGKTLLARAVAGEAGVPFFSISGSEFVEMFVGVGASRVRDLFEQTKRHAPAIVFIDEIDAVGRHRGAGLGGGHDEREQTLNQILVEMDGFDTNTNVIIIAATNRPDILDPALLRPGRFDRRVILDSPDLIGRLAILKVHTLENPLDEDVDLEIVAKETVGFSGADLANLVNESAILAARRSKKKITLLDFTESVDRVLMGPERRSRVISQNEKEVTAYHEAGHALVGHILPNADPVHKISIVSRGTAGGYTRSLPREDRYLTTKAQFQDMLAMALGGRAAEVVTFDEVTTGASSDLEHATRIARLMITRYAMGTRLDQEEIPISRVVDEAAAGLIGTIEVYGNDLLVYTKEGKVYRSRKEVDSSVVEILERLKVQQGVNGVQVYVKSGTGLGGLTPRVYGKHKEMVFLGKEITEERDYSLETERRIDEEVDRIIGTAYDNARQLLVENRAKLVQIARYLIDNGTVEGDKLQQLFDSPPPPLDDTPQPAPSS